MLHTVSIWLLAAAFAGAGLVNAIGAAGTPASFVRWGFPAWWGRLTGALEIAVAILVALPVSRAAALILGAAIIAAAVLTVLRHREFSHLAPLSVFAALLAVVAFTSPGWSL
jgi:hypothetical protein